MLDKLLAAMGLTIVVAEFYLSSFPPMDGLVVALGVLMIYIGSWRYVGRFIRRRSNTVLRNELNAFLGLVRQLYAHRSRGDAAAFHETKDELRDALERIISAAAVYHDPVPENSPARDRARQDAAAGDGTDAAAADGREADTGPPPDITPPELPQTAPGHS